MENESARVEEMENILIAAMQVLIDEKGIPVGKKLRIPVGILVLKSDLLSKKDIDKKVVLSALDRLLSLCNKRCHIVEIFFVSSVGKIGAEGEPPKNLSPIKVTEPMTWGLRNVEI